MAKISVFPLAVGNIKAPVNLLDKLFNNKVSPNMLYPLDLATNAIYSHAVQFKVFDYKTELLQNYNETIGVLGQTAASAIENIKTIDVTTLKEGAASNINAAIRSLQNPKATASDIKSATENLVKGVPEFLTKTANVIGPNSFKIIKDKPKATISLYMPDNLQTDYQSDYNKISITETLGPYGYLLSALGDTSFFSQYDNPAQLLSSPHIKQLAASAIGKIGTNIGLNGQNIKDLITTGLGQIPNPQLQLIYQGKDLRDFSLSFIFTPTSAKEAAEVDRIIDAFVYFSSPDYARSGDKPVNQYLIPPQIFDIQFKFTGISTSLGDAVGRIFKNNLNNVLGSQLSGYLFPTDATTQIQKAQDAKIFHVGDCVLLGVDVNYSPNGWSTFNNGYPIQTQMNLTFREMEIVTKSRLREWKPNQTFYNTPTENVIQSIDPQYDPKNIISL